MGVVLDITKTFKMVMLEKDLKQYEVGKRLDMNERQAFNRLLQKNEDLRIREAAKIADGLKCYIKISLVDYETGKEWSCEPQTETRTARQRLKAAVKAGQAQSVVNGTDNMTMDDIDAIIAEGRQEKQAQK